MAAISTQVAPGVTGAALTTTAANSGGDTVPNNNGRTLLIFENTSENPVTVTVDSTVCSFGEEHDAEVVVAAESVRVAGPFDRARYGSILTLAYSGVTGLTVAAIAAS
jgi:hypothetical protein